MSSFLKNLSLILFSMVILFPFNNCSYTDTSIFGADQGSLDTGSPSIAINAPNPFYVASDMQFITLQGSCTPGVYPENYIFWTLSTLNGQTTSDSKAAGGGQFFSSCVNGQYSIDIRVPCPGLINVGQNCFGLLSQLKLTLKIQGRTATGADAPGALSSASPITISP